MNVLPDSIFRYRNEINKRELAEIQALYEKIWEKLSVNPPDGYDNDAPKSDLIKDKPVYYPVYLIGGIKIVKKQQIEVYVTHTEPFCPIYNKFILELIIDSI